MPFHVTMILADAAQALNNKLFILGGGWSVTGPDPIPSAIARHIKVPWDQANERHELRLELVDSDGNPATVPSPIGVQPIVLETEFEVGRPPRLARGADRPLARYESWTVAVGARDALRASGAQHRR